MSGPLNTSKGGLKWSLIDAGDDKFALQASVDEAELKRVLDRNKRIAATGTKGYIDDEKTMAHKAHIPPYVNELWKNMYGVDVFNPDHLDKVLKLLDDPDWADLRTGQGRVSYR